MPLRLSRPRTLLETGDTGCVAPSSVRPEHQGRARTIADGAETMTLARGGRISYGIRAHPLPAFFVLAYAVSWLLLLLLIDVWHQPAAVAILVQTLGPTIAARIVLTTMGGRPAYRAMRKVGRVWRVPLRWYVIALVGIPATCLGVVTVLRVGWPRFGSPRPDPWRPRSRRS